MSTYWELFYLLEYIAVNEAKSLFLWSLYSSGGKNIDTITKEVPHTIFRMVRNTTRKHKLGRVRGMVVVAVRSQLFIQNYPRESSVRRWRLSRDLKEVKELFV